MLNRLPLHEVHATAGAVTAPQDGWAVPRHFGSEDAEYRAALETAVIFDLSHFTKVALAGPDARTFLHNLCTNDVKNLPVGGGCETFLTTNKARVIAHGWVGHYQAADGPVLWLDTVPGQADKLLAHFNRYLISEQVELADRTADLALFRLCGPHAIELLRKVVGESCQGLPNLGNCREEWRDAGPGFVRRHLLLAIEGFDVLCPAAAAGAIWDQLRRAGARPAGMHAYEVLRLEAGLPAYGVDVDESRLAMEVGRTADAISYNKGCYLGQETIVMARDRGHANRTLLGLKAANGPILPPGTKLFHDATEVGEVTSSAYSPRLGRVIALAYLKRDWQAPGMEVTTADGRRGLVASLPFVGAHVTAVQ